MKLFSIALFFIRACWKKYIFALFIVGSFLAVGGFLNFMLTGSIPAIRFGVVLGTALLALSIASLRSWRSGCASPLLLKGQAG